MAHIRFNTRVVQLAEDRLAVLDNLVARINSQVDRLVDKVAEAQRPAAGQVDKVTKKKYKKVTIFPMAFLCIFFFVLEHFLNCNFLQAHQQLDTQLAAVGQLLQITKLLAAI